MRKLLGTIDGGYWKGICFILAAMTVLVWLFNVEIVTSEYTSITGTDIRGESSIRHIHAPRRGAALGLFPMRFWSCTTSTREELPTDLTLFTTGTKPILYL